jgi:DNA-directed RNA polymerase specialized sigma subunit
MGKAKGGNVDPVAAELTAIKQLLIVSLLRDGVKQKHIAAALGVHESQISRSLPKGFAAAVKDDREDRN